MLHVCGCKIDADYLHGDLFVALSFSSVRNTWPQLCGADRVRRMLHCKEPSVRAHTSVH